MKKVFKILAIGAVIGAAVYGIKKYLEKKDESFNGYFDEYDEDDEEPLYPDEDIFEDEFNPEKTEAKETNKVSVEVKEETKTTEEKKENLKQEPEAEEKTKDTENQSKSKK